MNEKFVYIELSNGETFKLSTNNFNDVLEFNRKVGCIMSEEDELLYWLEHNIVWSDINNLCTKVEVDPLNYVAKFDRENVVINCFWIE